MTFKVAHPNPDPFRDETRYKPVKLVRPLPCAMQLIVERMGGAATLAGFA